VDDLIWATTWGGSGRMDGSGMLDVCLHYPPGSWWSVFQAAILWVRWARWARSVCVSMMSMRGREYV